MPGKVIDLDPNKRLSKEVFKSIQDTMAAYKHEDLQSLVIMYTGKDGSTSLEAYGVDWAVLGICQAYLEELRFQALHEGDGDEEADS